MAIIPKIPKLPINLKALGKAGQAFVGQGSAETIINILIDKTAPLQMIESCQDYLKPEPQSAQIDINTFFEDLPKLDNDATLTIVLAGQSEHCHRLLEIALWSEHPLVALSTDVPGLINSVDHADAVSIAQHILDFPSVDDFDNDDFQKEIDEFFAGLAKWCSRELSDSRINLGRAFLFMRQTIAFDLTKQTALENAVISAVFFLPGADLPVLTLNQCKLLYQIAVMYDIPLTTSRFKELAVVITAAFGCRSLVRLLLKKPKPFAWAVRGSVSYAATMSIGHLAFNFYQNNGDFKEIGKMLEHQGDILKNEIVTLPNRLSPSKTKEIN